MMLDMCIYHACIPHSTLQALVRLAPMTAWVNHKIIITILAPHIQPPAFPDKDSPAEVTKGYVRVVMCITMCVYVHAVLK